MLTTASVLSERAVSSYNLSIGTSLAIESIAKGPDAYYDPEREIPQIVDLTKYEEVWINIATLFRNILGSISAAQGLLAYPSDILDVLTYEVELLREIITNLSYGAVKPHFYYCDYSDLASKHPQAILQVDKTDKQKEKSLILKLVCEKFIENHKKDNDVHVFRSTVKPQKPTTALIMTHYAYDLLSQKQFKELHLLESHTGVLKKPGLFYTKLHDGKKLARIPFAAWSLQVFGDSQHFTSFPIAVRTQILTLAEERKWTAVTTKERVAYSLGTLRDALTAKTLTSMLSE